MAKGVSVIYSSASSDLLCLVDRALSRSLEGPCCELVILARAGNSPYSPPKTLHYLRVSTMYSTYALLAGYLGSGPSFETEIDSLNKAAMNETIIP